MVGAMMRAVRSMGYYDSTHPVFVRSLEEAITALSSAVTEGDSVTVGCGGSSVLYDTDSDPIKTDHCNDFAKRMFERSLIAVRLKRDAQAEHITTLLSMLAESPVRLRAEGGANAFMKGAAASSLEVIEVDYAKIFSGELADLSVIVKDDPVIERAVHEVLAFQSGGQGHALEVKIDELTTPETLGDFLDELLAEAPSLTGAGEGGGDAIDEETVGRLASQAYLSNQKHVRRSTSAAAEVAASARALSDRLVRLAPQARLKLLMELAAEADDDDAVGALGDAMPGGVIADALAAGLTSERSDSGVVEAVADLVKRLRPLEKDRNELLATVDGAIGNEAASGQAWQQITRRAMDRADVGQIKLHDPEVKQKLIGAHKIRLESGGAGTAGFEIFTSDREQRLQRQTAQVVSEVLEGCATVASAVISSTRSLIERLEAGDEFESSTTLIAALANRADLDRRADRPTMMPGAPTVPPPGDDTDSEATAVARPSALEGLAPGVSSEGDDTTSAHTVLSSLLGGAHGAARAVRWVKRHAVRGETATALLLESIDSTTDPEQRKLLLSRLAEVDAPTLQRVGLDDDTTSPTRVVLLIETLARRDVSAAMRLARHGLRSPSGAVKASALKALVAIEDPLAIDHLGIACGTEGEDKARALLGCEKDKSAYHDLQNHALRYLAASRSPYAVRHIEALVTQPSARFFKNKRTEALRLAAARALVAHGAPEAFDALRDGLEHSDKIVRITCKQVLDSNPPPAMKDADA